MDAKEAAAEIKGLSAQFFSGAYVTPKWGVFTKNLESIIQQAIDSRVAELEVMLIGLAKDFEGACNYTDAPCNPRDSRWYAMWQDGEFVHDDPEIAVLKKQLAAQAARIKELEAEIARLKNVQSLFAAIGMKDARIAELEAALKPFADWYEKYVSCAITFAEAKNKLCERYFIDATKALKGGE